MHIIPLASVFHNWVQLKSIFWILLLKSAGPLQVEDQHLLRLYLSLFIFLIDIQGLLCGWNCYLCELSGELFRMFSIILVTPDKSTGLNLSCIKLKSHFITIKLTLAAMLCGFSSISNEHSIISQGCNGLYPPHRESSGNLVHSCFMSTQPLT